jgi:hypothetical protein
MFPAIAMMSLALAGSAPVLAQAPADKTPPPAAPGSPPFLIRQGLNRYQPHRRRRAPPKDPAADRTHAANEAEAKLRKTLLAVPKGACTKDVADTRKAYDAAKKRTNDAIDAEVDASPEVRAARVGLKAAQDAFDQLGPNPDPAVSRAASDRVDEAVTARHNADLADRKRIADREHFQPVLDPDCPPKASAPPPPVVPDPNSHSSATGSVLQGDVLQGVGVVAAPVAQPNRGDDKSQPARPASAPRTGP